MAENFYEQLAADGAAAIEHAVDASWRNGHIWGTHTERERLLVMFEAYGRLCKQVVVQVELDRCMLYLRDGSCLCPQIRREIEGGRID